MEETRVSDDNNSSGNKKELTIKEEVPTTTLDNYFIRKNPIYK